MKSVWGDMKHDPEVTFRGGQLDQGNRKMVELKAER